MAGKFELPHFALILLLSTKSSFQMTWVLLSSITVAVQKLFTTNFTGAQYVALQIKIGRRRVKCLFG
jgi:hypothetical protein